MSDPKMKMVKCSKDEFELGVNIHKFTSDFLNRNLGRRLPPTREEVNLHWSWQVMNAYPNSDDPKRIFLLDQMSCPLIETLWEKRVDEEAFRHKRARQSESGFHTIKRKPTERERKKHLYAAIMTHTLHGDVIVPDILLRPLNKISYLDLIHKILTANPTKNLDLFVLYDLWEAILTKIYDYEYNWREDKKDEGRTADIFEYLKIVRDAAVSKKRKHSEVEEESDDSDAPLVKTKQAKIPANVSEASGASGPRDGQLSRPEARTPAPTRPSNATPVRALRTAPRSALSSSGRRVQPQPSSPPPPSQSSGRQPMSDRGFRLLSNGIPPWDYDPLTGEKMKTTTGWKTKK